MTTQEVRAVAARAARTSYGRLIAILAASSGDLAGAEDALQNSLEQALRSWQESGIPANPEAWLVTVARNRRRDEWKAASARDLPLEDHDVAHDPLAAVDLDAIGDKRLELLFVCAHPAIDPRVRTPLMLQTVLGFEATQIAAAFATSPAAMAQRLVRAKRRIRDARIPFVVPERREIPERVAPVLEAIYGCAALMWRGDVGSLAGEARHLAVALATLLGDQREAWGLAALVTLSLARRPETFVPLDEQDPAQWDAAMIAEGEGYLRRAQGGAPGRFELEAAIQAVHIDRARTGATDLLALRQLYAALLAVAPSAGAEVAAAAVVGRLDGAAAGLEALGPARPDFQPWWAVRAELLERSGREGEAADAYERAAVLADEPSVRAHLRDAAARARRS